MKTYTRKVIFLFIALFTITYASCLVPKKGPIRQLTHIQNQKKVFDAIIVPGIPYDGNGWDSIMKARVIWAYTLYKNGVTKNIIFSGDAVYSPYRESQVMGLYAEAIGIPQKHIFFDTLARHSTENVYYSYLLAKELGFKSLALATDPFQAFTLKAYSRKRFGTPVYHLPFIVDTLKTYNYFNPKINASHIKVQNFESITAQQGFFRRFKRNYGQRHKLEAIQKQTSSCTINYINY